MLASLILGLSNDKEQQFNVDLICHAYYEWLGGTEPDVSSCKELQAVFNKDEILGINVENVENADELKALHEKIAELAKANNSDSFNNICFRRLPALALFAHKFQSV